MYICLSEKSEFVLFLNKLLQVPVAPEHLVAVTVLQQFVIDSFLN